VQKTSTFSSVRTDKERGVEPVLTFCGQGGGSQFLAILSVRPLRTASYLILTMQIKDQIEPYQIIKAIGIWSMHLLQADPTPLVKNL